MRYRELAAMQAGRLGPKRYGSVGQARRAATPHVVDVLGLDEEMIGWQQCAAELHNRREWCKEFCRDDWEVEPIRDERMRLIGRQFRFADVVDAVYFKLRFGSSITGK